MDFRKRVYIRHPAVIGMLLGSAEGLHEVELDEARAILGNHSTSIIDQNPVHYHFRRACAIQEVMQLLKHAIPPASHEHPTIIPLSSQEQVEVMDTIIDCTFDWQNDMVTEPLWGLRACLPTLTTERVDQLKAEMNAGIDQLVAITELRAAWKEQLR